MLPQVINIRRISIDISISMLDTYHIVDDVKIETQTGTSERGREKEIM